MENRRWTYFKGTRVKYRIGCIGNRPCTEKDYQGVIFRTEYLCKELQSLRPDDWHPVIHGAFCDFKNKENDISILQVRASCEVIKTACIKAIQMIKKQTYPQWERLSAVDNVLAKTFAGQTFIKIYYAVSPY